MFWSYLLSAVGVFGLWLAGRNDPRGWLVGLAAQGLWITFAISTQQYGFILASLAYGTVYARNARRWYQATALGSSPNTSPATRRAEPKSPDSPRRPAPPVDRPVLSGPRPTLPV